MLIGNSRFVREYELFGGQVMVAFRSLTQQEKDMAITQASYDDRDGEIPVNHEFFRRATNYEMALSLHQLRLGGRLVQFDLIQDVLASEKTADGKPQTKLKDYYKYVMTSHLNKDSMFRAVLVLRDRFRNLQLKLEANMHNKDFWFGIAPRA